MEWYIGYIMKIEDDTAIIHISYHDYKIFDPKGNNGRGAWRHPGVLRRRNIKTIYMFNKENETAIDDRTILGELILIKTNAGETPSEYEPEDNLKSYLLMSVKDNRFLNQYAMDLYRQAFIAFLQWSNQKLFISYNDGTQKFHSFVVDVFHEVFCQQYGKNFGPCYPSVTAHIPKSSWWYKD